ncbi:uncharacterized protein RSE6_13894 [Rhynchosporium secalis]|uniref:Uncharacterized protein n=1 Tax=Rhynchosporium secalis TaxID=38038 RepID=A0A1E1MTX5_RHYSE|nr:uncharacterized protein RSE6_13894 [Rhynchosporium secalis]
MDELLHRRSGKNERHDYDVHTLSCLGLGAFMVLGRDTVGNGMVNLLAVRYNQTDWMEGMSRYAT